MTAAMDLRRSADRFGTDVGWLDSRHSFSFGRHYDPRNTHFGVLVVSNDDVVQPGTGFETHPHRDMEIVTWVLEGSLVHQDSEGHSGAIYPGLAQRMSAGTGIRHSEKNDSWRLSGDPQHSEPVRFVQMWVAPDRTGVAPSYQQLEIGDELARGGLVPVASGMRRYEQGAAISIHNQHAAFLVGRLAGGDVVALPVAPFVHLYVARGAVTLEGAGSLVAGDAVRVSDGGGQRLTATDHAEVLVWEMHAGLTA